MVARALAARRQAVFIKTTMDRDREPGPDSQCDNASTTNELLD
jgi:hypothetical protein